MHQGSNLEASFSMNQSGEPVSSALHINNTPSTFNPFNSFQNSQIPMQQGPTFQSQFSLKQNPQMLVSTAQIEVINQNNNARNIETKIYSGYCFYTCLVYWEMLISVACLVFYVIIKVEASEIVLIILAALAMLTGCTFALFAKSELDSKKQFISFVLFIISTVLSIIGTILSVVYLKDSDNSDSSDVVSVLTILVIPEQFIVGVALIWNAYRLVRLMKERDHLLHDISEKTSSVMISARF